MESLIATSTPAWRGVSPVASGGPSGSSLTLRVLFVMDEPYGDNGPGIKHLFERRVAAATYPGGTRRGAGVRSLGIGEPDRVDHGRQLGTSGRRRVPRPDLLDVDRVPVDVDDPDVHDPPGAGVLDEPVAGGVEDDGVGPALLDRLRDPHPHPGRRVAELP